MDNEIWPLETGWLAAYTEDREIMRKIRRYYPDWTVMVEYYRFGKRKGVQYRIPANDRRKAERVFACKKSKNKPL